MKEEVYPASVEQWLGLLRSETLARAKALIELTLAQEQSLPPMTPMANTYASLATLMRDEANSSPVSAASIDRTGTRRRSTASASSSATDSSGMNKRKKLDRSQSQLSADTRTTRSKTASGHEMANVAGPSSVPNPIDITRTCSCIVYGLGRGRGRGRRLEPLAGSIHQNLP
ncbi:hypothetical protein DMENIID0001_037910 [Sergentomyia squamirostris]